MDQGNRRHNKSLELYPSLWLYHRYTPYLAPPPHSSLPDFQGRSELVKLRIADVWLSRHLCANGCCDVCGEPLPPIARFDSTYSYFLIHHFYLTCSPVRAILLTALIDWAQWLPTSWISLPWHEQLAHVLLLIPPSPIQFLGKAARQIGHHLVTVQRLLQRHHTSRLRLAGK